MVRKTLGKYGGNHYGRGLNGSRKRKEKQKGGEETSYDNNTIYIRKVLGNEDEYIYPIIKNIFPNKRIEFSNSRESYDLNVYSQYDFIPSNSSIPYIYTCGERWDKIIQKQTFVDPKCIANILTTEQVEKVNNYYYIPFFLNVGPKIYNESPFVREYDSSNRNKLAAYLATHSPEHRDKFFKALHALDATVESLGSANNTVQEDIPSRKDWWDSPQIFKDYKFGFAMENMNEDGYITEKIMNVYRGGAIPLYWGTSKVKEIFHQDSFIYLNDYPSLEEAARDVITISKDENRMKKMFSAPIFKEDINPDYSKYYDTPSPQWVIDIANEIKNRLEQTGGNKYKKKGGEKNTLVVKLKAGLGNRLFQILAGYGIAEKYSMNIKVIDLGYNHVPEEESKSNIKQLFPNIEFLNNSANLSGYKGISEQEEFVYHDIENPNGNATLEGYFQSEKYFPKKLPEINLVEPTNNLIKDINKEKLFFIHFRLGDYTGNKNVNYFSNNTIGNYYRHCIKKIKEKYLDAIFIIISNKNVETKKYIQDELSNELSGNQIIYTDDSNSARLDSLYYMSKCKGGIAVNSTFSWFGTFFIRNNDKNFIFMVKPWFSRFDSNKQYDVYPSWTTLVDVNIKSGGEKKTLVVNLGGGLGNRLFKILAGYGFAEKWNMNLKILYIGGNHVPEEESKSNIKQLFPNIEFLNNSANLSGYKGISEQEEFVYHDIENPNGNATLEGYFQSEKYFPKKLPEINLVEPTNNLIKDINKEKLFFIHFRLGDYLSHKDFNNFSNNKSRDYYRHCIKKIKEKYSDAIFIISANDTTSVKKFIQDELSNELSGNQIIYADESSSARLDSLYYMSKCKGGIASNSSFSWFGTFFIRNNDKNFIFVMKPWFPKFKSDKEYDIYPSWATHVDINIKSGGSETKSKAYVINLDERTDRWENIQKYFKDSSISLERISGIRNKNGHLGCGLSIQKVVKLAKDNSMETVLIFEDDNKPLENFDKRWQTAKQWLDSNMDKWDIFNGSAKLGEGHNEKNVRLKYKLDNNVNFFEADYILNTNWIYVNKSVYDKILSWNTKVVWAIDRFVGDKIYMRNLLIFPFLSLQDNGMSNTNTYIKNYNSDNNNRIAVLQLALNQQKGGKRKCKTKKNKKVSKKYKGGNSKYSAIIVEPRKHKALEFVLKNILENLDDRWNIIIFHGNLNKEYIENIITTSLQKYKNRISIKSLNKDNLSLQDYNEVLTSKEFYDNIPTEMFLVFQTDSMINPRNKDKIYDFMQYDYVGAPWVGERNPSKGDVGNGGFSLRRKSKMLEIIDKVPYNTFAEDVYFASPPPTIQINKPTMEQAQKFSSDEEWDKDSFGVHKVWVHVDNSILINDFPEIKTLIDLQDVQEGGDTPIDIVITFHSKDAKILPYSLKGLENINKGNIYLITNEDPKIENTIFIDEKLFPFKKDDLIEYIGVENGHRAGWYYQQLLKIYAYKIVPNLTENYLVVDSETVFLNPVKFVDENKLLFATGKEIHKPYFNHMNCLFHGTLKMKYSDKSGIAHHMVFNKNYLQEMFDKIQNLNNSEPWKAYMKCVNREYAGLSGMSEYEIFFNYMLEYKSDNAKLRDLRWANVQDVPNYSTYNSIDELLVECKKNYDCITLHEMFFRGTKMNLDNNGR